MGVSTLTITSISTLNLIGCATPKKHTGAPLPFTPIAPSDKDEVILADGLTYNMLAAWNDPINKQGQRFGFNNDFIAFLPLTDKNFEAILWVNHEATHPLFVSGYKGSGVKTKDQIIREQQSVGGSFLKIKRKDQNSPWEFVFDDPINRRLDATTKIPFAPAQSIQGQKEAIGTLANCAGGVTPWGNILTCEENYEDCYGEVEFDLKGKRKLNTDSAFYKWWTHYKYPPEHYGWVVEVNPYTGAAKKLVSLGRFSHESATVIGSESDRLVVYSGDDKEFECLYKFVADKPGSLESGELFVADLDKKMWHSLDIEKQPALKKKFKNQQEVLIRCREAAKLVGGTPLDRAEDIERDPISGDIFVALTNNKTDKNYYGSILRISEKNNDPYATEFEFKTFLGGGPESGFACPDNLVFDRLGNLWFCVDVSGSSLNKEPYESMKNNGLFFVPVSGPHAGRALQVASAPRDAEFTGPCFSADGSTLFLSVQHPGETTKELNDLKSHWPNEEGQTPQPAVIQISGPLLDRLTGRA